MRAVLLIILNVMIFGMFSSNVQARFITIEAPDDYELYLSKSNELWYWGDSIFTPENLEYLGMGNTKVNTKRFVEVPYLVVRKEGHAIHVMRADDVYGWTLQVPKLKPLPEWAEGDFYIQLDDVSVKVETDENKSGTPNKYSYFAREDYQEEDDLFTDMGKFLRYSINDLLRKGGYAPRKAKLAKSYSKWLELKMEVWSTNHTRFDVYYQVRYSEIHMKLTICDSYGAELNELETSYSTDDSHHPGFVQFLNQETLDFLTNKPDQQLLTSNFDSAMVATLDTDPIAISHYKDPATTLDPGRGVVSVLTPGGHGSGIIISSEGYFITNHHVAYGEDTIQVEFSDGTKRKCKMVRSNPFVDLALLQLDTLAGKEVQEQFLNHGYELSDSIDLKQGQDVLVIGTPLDPRLGHSVSRGSISSIRELNESTLIQTDATVNSGNSGGALVGGDGTLLGVISSKLVGFGVNGVGFAIPIDEAMTSLNLRYE